MKKRNFTCFLSVMVIIELIIIIYVFLSNIEINKNKGIITKDGYVPDESTAIKIAEAVWYPIYGDDIYKNLPFIAEYNQNEKCWYVTGTLAPNTIGGVPEIKINKKTGQIEYLNHGK